MNDQIIDIPPLAIEIIVESPPVIEYVEIAPPAVELWMTAPGPKGDPGDPGPPGPPGSGSTTLVFTQIAPSTVWLVNHNLSKYPAIAVIDSGGTVVYGDIEYLSDQVVQITFSTAFSGQVYCN